ncbi:MAG TPA: hypothetical protein VLG69_04550 [Candidatus Andersenbacteria bacterium]|nr:hypothetical protein [Candidatus Andersenbacteria bacterium]
MKNLVESIGWVRIAGNAEAIQRGAAPYWRFTPHLSGEVNQSFVHEIWITGDADGLNMHDGMEKGANFLLWFQMYGVFSVFKEGEKQILRIALKKVPEDQFLVNFNPVQEIWGRVCVYGAPDLARQGNIDRWRCVVEGKEFVVQSIGVMGAVTHDNFHTSEDVSPENDSKYRKQWLEFKGALRTDSHGNGRIQVY